MGTGAELGPGVVLADRTRLPGKPSPAMVGAGAKVGAGAVIAGVKVGEGAVVAAGEVVEDDMPSPSVSEEVGSVMEGNDLEPSPWTWLDVFESQACDPNAEGDRLTEERGALPNTNAE